MSLQRLDAAVWPRISVRIVNLRICLDRDNAFTKRGFFLLQARRHVVSGSEAHKVARLVVLDAFYAVLRQISFSALLDLLSTHDGVFEQTASPSTLVVSMRELTVLHGRSFSVFDYFFMMLGNRHDGMHRVNA